MKTYLDCLPCFMRQALWAGRIAICDEKKIKERNKPVTYVVRDIPVINNMTYKNAIASGLEEVAEIISSGTTAPGTILHTYNTTFLEKFNHADMIISKGQGNYEGLSNVDRSVFFLLKAKYSIIANNLNVKENDIVLKKIN